MAYTRTSITLEEPTFKKGKRLAKGRGFGASFSAYVARLIEEDDENTKGKKGAKRLPIV